MAHFEFIDVSFAYSVDNVLRNVNFSLDKGQKVSLIGQNGAGKSTAFKLACGILRPTGGNISILDTNPEEESVRRKIGYLPEEPIPYRLLSVRENLEYSASLRGVDNIREAADWAMELFDLRVFDMTKAAMLSRGNIQRLALGMATLHNPEILILDEPLNYLDIPTQERLVKFISTSSKTVLVSTHLVSTATRLTKELMLLSGGTIKWRGKFSDLDNFGTETDSMESKIVRLMQTE